VGEGGKGNPLLLLWGDRGSVSTKKNRGNESRFKDGILEVHSGMTAERKKKFSKSAKREGKGKKKKKKKILRDMPLSIPSRKREPTVRSEGGSVVEKKNWFPSSVRKIRISIPL